MRLLHTSMALCAVAALAANADEGAAMLGDVTEVSGGQMALTAHNNGDGTWSVTLGPGGDVLKDRLPRDLALAIVGAPTPPYTPANEQERYAAELRLECERKARELANAKALQTDEEADAETEKTGQALADENASLKAEIERLKAQVAKFDKDGDGNVGGGASNERNVGGEVEIPGDWEGLHWTQRVKMAKAIKDSDDDLNAEQANEVIAAEVARRAPDSSAPADGVEGAGNNGGE